jgi:hypothetical protein
MDVYETCVRNFCNLNYNVLFKRWTYLQDVWYTLNKTETYPCKKVYTYPCKKAYKSEIEYSKKKYFFGIKNLLWGNRLKSPTAHRIGTLKWQWAGHISRRIDNRWSKRVLESRPRLGKRSVERPQARLKWRFAQDGWQELDASSRRPSEMARSWRGLCRAVDCNQKIQKVYFVYNNKLIHIWDYLVSIFANTSVR